MGNINQLVTCLLLGSLVGCSQPIIQNTSLSPSSSSSSSSSSESYISDRKLYDAGKYEQLEQRLKAKTNPNYEVNSSEDVMNLFRLAHVKYKIAERDNDFGNPMVRTYGSAEHIYGELYSNVPFKFLGSDSARAGAMFGRAAAHLRREKVENLEIVESALRGVILNAGFDLKSSLKYVEDPHFLFGK